MFGGDGATLAVPSSALAAVKRALGAKRRLARVQSSLELRAGIVPFSDIRNAGADVLLAKFQLSPVNNIAMLTGGLQLVDAMIMSAEGNNQYHIPFTENDEAPET